MKFLHISDLHIGKYVNGYRMLDDQRYMLERIVEIIKEKNPDALLIAGDIYDKSLPSDLHPQTAVIITVNIVI